MHTDKQPLVQWNIDAAKWSLYRRPPPGLRRVMACNIVISVTGTTPNTARHPEQLSTPAVLVRDLVIDPGVSGSDGACLKLTSQNAA